MVVSGSVTLRETASAPHSGLQSLELNGLSPGRISRTFATTPGRSYRIDWYDASNTNPVCGSGPRTYKLHVTGNSDISVDPNPVLPASAADYGFNSVTIVATATSTDVDFESRTSLVCGAIIDDVSFTAL